MALDLLVERFRMESDLVINSKNNRANLSNDEEDRALKSLLVLGRDLPTHCRQAMNSLWALITAGKVDDIQGEGERFQSLLAAVIDGLAESNEPELQQIRDQLDALRQEHQDTWPWCTEEEITAAYAESARGETIELDDAFAQIAGVGREEWLRRVEAHQQQKRSQQGE